MSAREVDRSHFPGIRNGNVLPSREQRQSPLVFLILSPTTGFVIGAVRYIRDRSTWGYSFRLKQGES